MHVFKECRLSITTKANLTVVSFLEVELHLINCIYRSYRKPNENPVHIDINSTHPQSIKKQIPKSISKTISKVSSKEEAFNNNRGTCSDT